MRARPGDETVALFAGVLAVGIPIFDFEEERNCRSLRFILILGWLLWRGNRAIVGMNLTRRLRRFRRFHPTHAIRTNGHDYGVTVFGFGLYQEGILQKLHVGETGLLQVLCDLTDGQSRPLTRTLLFGDV